MGALTAFAAAAVALLVWRSSSHDEGAKVVVIAAAPETATAPKAVASTAPTTKPDDAVDPTALPVAVASPPAPSIAFTAPAATTAASLALAPTAASTPAAPSASARVADNGAPLLDQMRQAAGPSARTADPVPTPAAEAPETMPTRPSMGAVSGAIGAVMNAARACLGPDDPVSHAQVSFQSNGSVQSVAITGGAAGKPVEACIRAALMRAKVAPFAQPTFTYTVTVRPL